MEESGQLKKSIGLWTATAIAIGITVGSGIFVKPGKVLGQAGSPSMAILAWVLGGLMSIAGGLTVAEIAARIPKTGGIYTYIEEIYGPIPGFLSGWVQTFIYGPGLIGALGLYFATLLQPYMGYESSKIPLIAIGAALFLMCMNILATKVGGIIQNITTVAKMLPIYAIFIFGMLKGGMKIFGDFSESANLQISFGSAVLSTLWAYDGWILVGNVAGEMENSKKNLPRAIILGLVIVIVGYLGLNLALFHNMSPDKIYLFGPNAPGRVALSVFGSWGGNLVSIGILISIFGCLNGTILSSPRIPYAMAARGDMKGCGWLSYVHPKFSTPIFAIMAETLIGILMILLASPDQITDFAIFSVYVFYTMAFVGLFLLRKREPNYEGYKTPLFPIIPAFAIVAALYILGSTIVMQTKIAAISAVITLSGIPFYLLLRKKEVMATEAEEASS